MNYKNKLNKNNIKENLNTLLKSPLIYILLLCAFVQRVVYFFTDKFTTLYDTTSYVDYNENIFKGQVSSFRTPVYPYFIKVVRKIFGEEQIYNSVVFMQYILFFVSIIFFYLTITKISKNKIITTISTIIYGISPFIFLWNNTILTESLAICAITVLSYMTISYLKKPNDFFPYCIGIYIFGLIMLRPAFIYIIAVYLVFWIIRCLTNKLEKNKNIKGIISILGCAILVLIYCLLVKIQHGNFEISSVTVINKLAGVVRSGAYVDGDNKDIIDTINNELKGKNLEQNFFACTEKVNYNFKSDDINKFCSSVYKNSTTKYVYYIVQNVLDLGNRNIGTRYAGYNLENLGSTFRVMYFYEMYIFPMNFIHLYILIIISLILLIYFIFKNKKIEWILAFLISMITGNLFTMILGSHGEYQRLFSSSMPLVIILIAYLINIEIVRIGFENLNNEMLEIKYKKS